MWEEFGYKMIASNQDRRTKKAGDFWKLIILQSQEEEAVERDDRYTSGLYDCYHCSKCSSVSHDN